MTCKTGYPRGKVITGFVFSPALMGLALVLGDLVASLVTTGTTEEPSFYFNFGTLFMLFGLLYYGLPAGLIGVMCVVLRLRRTLAALAGLSLVGAAVGYGWDQLLRILIDTDRAIPTLPVLEHATPTVLAAGVSLVMGFLLLPRKPSLPAADQ
ncbi:hypothetical protein [Pseudomonas farsensis]|uniref:Uncharacterized protein n=1 Tax=Pseudomonas farsensis TaxID=2745492 RepID=A0ABU8QSH0_9PSED